MITLDDKIIRYFNKLTKKELVTYLMISRYLTEGEKIPLDNIQSVLNQTSNELIFTLGTLINAGVIKFLSEGEIDFSAAHEMDQFFKLKDCISSKEGFVTLREKNKKSLSFIIYIYNNYIKNNKYKYLKDYNSKNETEREGEIISAEQSKVTANWRRVLRHALNRDINARANMLVDHLADRLNKMYNMNQSGNWRMGQLKCAKRLFKDHNYSLDVWKSAIDYFTEQEYWQDKLNSLKQVEKNLHQFISKGLKKSSKPSTDVKVVK